MADSGPLPVPREGYRPEWLALEDASGGRYQMVGDFNVDVPTYNAVFEAMSKQWPQYENDLEVWVETADSSLNNTTVRIYQPKSILDAPLPLTIFYHGGGYIAGTLDTEDAQARYFAAKTPCLVISIDYEKVSQPGVNLDKIINQYGVPSVPWCRNRAAELGADVSKTVLCGGSAGAFLAAQVAFHYMEMGDTGSIAGLVLLFAVAFPYTYGENGKHKEKFTAWEENGNAHVPIVNRKLAEFIWSHYEADFNSPRHFPGLAQDLSKWPPTFIASAEKDCFRDDGQLLDELLRNAGVPSKLDYYAGLPHYFHAFPALAVAHELMANAVDGVHFVLQTKEAS